MLIDNPLTRPPQLLRRLLPGCEWSGPPRTAAGRPVLYFTFDDGPVPDETPWVLEQLAQYSARATFFCVGQNLERYPDVARAALAAGQRLGNHTHRHRSAWATGRAEYLAEVTRCQEVLQSLHAEAAPPLHHSTTPPLFRPPYGRLTWALLRRLRPQFRVLMWSVLTRDYDAALPPERALRLTLAAAGPGDVLVFHDSQKASRSLRFLLPRVLAHYAEQGYEFWAV